MKIGYEFMIDLASIPNWMLWIGAAFLFLFALMWFAIVGAMLRRFFTLRKKTLNAGYSRRHGVRGRDRLEAQRRGFKL